MSEAEFLAAAQDGDIILIRQILKHQKKFNIDVQEASGKTALMYLAALNSDTGVRLLLECGAKIMLKEHEGGQTALHIAARCGSFLSALVLVQFGADVDDNDNFKRTPLHWCIESSSLDTLVVLLRHAPSVNVDAGDAMLQTPLHMACSKGLDSHVRILLKFSASVFVRDNGGQNPFHKTAESKTIDCSRMLLAHNPNLLDQKDNSGRSLLHLAVLSGNLPLIQFLIQSGAAIVTVDHNSRTLMHALAAGSGSVDFANILLKNDVTLDTVADAGIRPLHVAIQFQRNELAKFLIEHGADASKQDAAGRSPLVHCVIFGNLEIAALLLSNYNVGIDVTDHEGFTPLMYAVSINARSMVDFLLDHGAHVDTTDKHSQTALHVALHAKSFELAVLLTSRGASVDHVNDRRRNALHIAAGGADAVTFDKLVRSSLDVSIKDIDLNTPLHEACSHGNLDTLRILLQSRASTDVKNGQHQRPIHLAALNGSLELCRALIEAGTRLDVIDNHRMTPLDIAESKSNVQLVRLFTAFGTPAFSQMQIRCAAFIQAWWRRKRKLLAAFSKENAVIILQYYTRKFLRLPPAQRRKLKYRNLMPAPNPALSSEQSSKITASATTPKPRSPYLTPARSRAGSPRQSTSARKEQSPSASQIASSSIVHFRVTSPSIHDGTLKVESRVGGNELQSHQLSSVSQSSILSHPLPAGIAEQNAASNVVNSPSKSPSVSAPSSRAQSALYHDTKLRQDPAPIISRESSLCAGGVDDLIRTAGMSLPRIATGAPQHPSRPPSKPSTPVKLPSIPNAHRQSSTHTRGTNSHASKVRHWDTTTTGSLPVRQPEPVISGQIYNRPLNFDAEYPGLVSPLISNRGQPVRKNYDQEKIRELQRVIATRNHEVEVLQAQLKSSVLINSEERVERQQQLLLQLETLKSVKRQFDQIREALAVGIRTNDIAKQQSLRRQLKTVLTETAKLQP